MDSLTFINQIIVNKGESVSSIYKLVQGSVSIVNNKQESVYKLQAPCYLNIIQCIYGVALTKTVKTSGKCIVKKIGMKQSHKSILKQFKQKGIRKSKFKLFEEIHSSKFYELVRLSEAISLRKDHQFKAKEKYYYLGVLGNMVVFDKQQNIKIVKLQEGQIFCIYNSGTSFIAQSQQVKLLEIHSDVVYTILSQQRQKLIQLSKNQRQTIQNFRNRSKVISHQIKRNYQRATSKISIPRHFTNSIQFRLNSYEKLCRAKSCFLQKNVQKKTKKQIATDIKTENQQNFKVLMALNRRRYGQEYIYKKRMQISEKVYSLSCTNTPPPAVSQVSQKKNIKLQEVARGLYEHASMDKNFGIIKMHPEIQKDKYLRLKNKHKTNLVKRAKNAERPKNTFPLDKDKDISQQLKWKIC